MKFTLSTSGNFYPNETERDKLINLGFVFVKSDYKKYIKTSFNPTIEINSLNDLIKFADEYGEIIIYNGHIEIYDD
jgi:hypothetical protein